ncbi:MAG: diaminopimelate epimerase [Tannerella sp.]|jgi:diaminopimelate epimerase|nr:diaminopimelate epimerase [Tannerella sp.]
MTKKIRFHKMHGAGNDYIYINTFIYPIAQPEAFARRWSMPHTGIGSDGLVLIGPSEKADFSMRIFNADGSEAMMCGNASRCVGKYVYEEGLTDKTVVMLETLSGIKELRLHVINGKVNEVTVDMGNPQIENKPVEIEAGGKKYEGTVVSMGNPHFVIFTDDIQSVELSKIGPVIEHHPMFPDRTNVEFVQVEGNREVQMSVWERGSGITQACGTGACATLSACASSGRTGRKAVIRMAGGALTIEWDEHTNKIWMTGDAVMVYEGFVETDIY